MTEPRPMPGGIPSFSLQRWRDASGPARATAAADLTAICHGLGFFYLVDHGVPHEFLGRHFAAMAEFFALPEPAKATVDKLRSPHFRGWERVGAELTNNRVDYREQLDLSTEYPPYPRGVEPPFLHLDGPNQWPADELVPGFRAVLGEFFDRMGSVAWELMEAMSTGLGLEPGALRDRFGERPLSFVKLINYPPTPAGEAGVNAHHDAGFLTLLLQGSVGGLQALDSDGRWIDVTPPPEAIVVNLGEMLQSMTGNYFVACTHRVVAAEPRQSTAYFHGPDLRASLAPLDLSAEFGEAVAASPRHRDAGFMARRDELLAGTGGIEAASTPIFGEQMWNYYVRSYPALVAEHYPELAG